MQLIIYIKFQYDKCCKIIASFSNDDGDGNKNVKKSNSLNNQNNNSGRALHFLVHFFAVTARLGREIHDDQFSFLRLSKLGCGLQEFNSRKFHLHLTFKAIWNNRDDDLKNRINFNRDDFAVFRCRRC